MKFSLNRGSAILLSLLLLCASCGDVDLFDTDKWSDKIEGWEPSVKAKVAHGTFTLWDLIHQEDDDIIVKEGNDLIIQYMEPDIYTIKADSIFKMPEQDIELKETCDINSDVSKTPTGYPVPEAGYTIKNIAIVSNVDEIPNDCEIKRLEASAVLIFPELGCNYRIKAEFPDITMNGTPLKIDEEIFKGNPYSMNLSNIELALDQTKTVNFTITEIYIPNGQVLESLKLNLDFGLNNLRFIKAIGKIKVHDITIDHGTFDMGVDFLEEIGGTFKFTKPELNIILRNKGVGVPMNVIATFDGSNDEISKTLKPNDGKLTTNGNRTNQIVNDTLGLNAENSNIVDFLSMPPKGNITYQGHVEVNPDDEEDNVIYNDAEVSLDAYVRIPFSLSAENLSYKDTLADIDIDQKYAKKIKEGTIEIVATNGLPLNLKIAQLILLDENGNVLESLTATKGKETLNASAKGSVEFKINNAQATKLGQTDKILLEVVASTTGNQEVAIAADATLEFNLMVSAKAVIEDLDDF